MTSQQAAAPLVAAGELRTERLRLCLPDPSWAPALSDYYLRNADHFAPYCPRRPPGFHSPEAWRERATAAREASLSGQALHLLLFRADASEDRIIGDVNFTNVVRGVFQAAYLGYQLDREHVGRGLMYEALAASIAHVFRHMQLHRLMANYVPSNERSGRLLRKLGFNVEGYARDYLFLDGAWKDHVLTSLINPDVREPS
ncbi:MAG TPA: GNAT family N-acetyltransferase [Polyangiaceae bacterium]|nr:GNAT family N-acetyltransferase [Polyangiaceae bacterium]